jgi:hypothetical protein
VNRCPAWDKGPVRENRAAADLTLDDAILNQLDAVFPTPSERRPLEML